MPKVYIKTFGCQMNKRDSEIVRGMLEEAGYAFTDNEDRADIIIFNTCSVRAHAEHRAMSIMGSISRKKKRNRVFGIIGCVAQHKKEGVFKSLPNIDFICGPSDIYRIPELVARSLEVKEDKKKKITAVSSKTRPLKAEEPYCRVSEDQALVNIMYGCNNFCSYCIVPYVRGKEVSRPADDIVREVENLVAKGILHITLLGQNVNSYSAISCQPSAISKNKKLKAECCDLKAETCGFIDLLKRVNGVRGIKKISFMTSHPKDATVELFKAMRDLDKVEKHLHLPLQSGSNRILKLMKRGYTIERYTGLVNNYRKIVKGAGLSTDIIVGFPSETEDDYNKTEDAIKNIGFDRAYIFKYSPRSPTKSSLMKDDVSFKEKKRRNNELLRIQKNISKGKRAEI